MNNIRALIVDDSNFSIRVIKKLLENCGVKVVGTALTVEEAVEKAEVLLPDLITMDITLPDGDGLEAARKILKFNRRFDIVVISSMMDDEIIQKCKEIGIKSCIQKPIDEEDFRTKLERLYEGDKLFSELTKSYVDAFVEASVSNLTRATKQKVGCEVYEFEEKIRKCLGLSITVGLVGSHRGRVVIDTSKKTAEEITKEVYEIEKVTDEDILEYFVELSNMICGNAASLLNGINRGFGIRVSPPTTFHGEDLTMVLGDIGSTSIRLETVYGEVYVNVGFQRGKAEWM